MAQTVTLNASADYGHTGQYIAQITGRAKGVQFARSFVGTKFGKRSESTAYETDECGLYEIQDVTRKGKQRNYYLVLPWMDELRRLRSEHEDALIIAKRLDDGQRLESFVTIEREPMTTTKTRTLCTECGAEMNNHCAAHPNAPGRLESYDVPALNDDGTPKHKLVYRILRLVEVEKAAAAANFEVVVQVIVAALEALPAGEQKKALALAKAQLFAKPEGGQP